MKNIPKNRLEAIASGKIEYATLDEGESRKRCIQIVNLMFTADRLGVQSQCVPFDFEAFLDKVESKGIRVSDRPYDSLTEVEKRSLSDSIRNVVSSLNTSGDIAHGKTFEQILAAVKSERSKKV